MDLFDNNWLTQHILTMLIIVPLAGAALIFARIDADAIWSRRTALGVSVLTLLLGVIALMRFNLEKGRTEESGCSLVERHVWIGEPQGEREGTWRDVARLQIEYHLGVDGISMPLILLTVFLTPLAIWGSFTAIQDRAREFYALLLLLHAAMIGVFCSRDLLIFYMFFEFTLVPLYFVIGIWGGAQRQKAANMFFIYTLAGSMLTFAGVLYLGWLASQFPLGPNQSRIFTFDLDVLYRLADKDNGYLSSTAQAVLFFAFFAGFAIKVPLFPFHTWLPLAHTEAPTAGSVILAGVLLKLGTYGFLRLSLPMLPHASAEYAPLIGVLAVVGIIYGAVAAWVQGDFKKLVAYSSVSHLGFCLLGMFSLKLDGLVGALLYMVNHGLSTGALFLVVGMVYERYHTREFSRIGGLAKKMPIMAFFLVIFTFASVGLPGLNGFVSEFLVLVGTFNSENHLGKVYAAFAALGIILSAVYMLHMARGLLFGPLREPGHGSDDSAGLTQDLTPREIGILAPLALACLWLGVFPGPTMHMMDDSLRNAVKFAIQNPKSRQPVPFSMVQPRHSDADTQDRPALAVMNDKFKAIRPPEADPSAKVGALMSDEHLTGEVR